MSSSETPATWIDYWKTEDIYHDANWQINMDIFVKGTIPLLKYSSADVILDIGCGPGYFEAFAKDVVREVHGLDTSDRYLEACRRRFQAVHNLFFYKLDEANYTDLSFLQPKRFSKIICLSVVQYYSDVGKVERLIEQVRQLALPGAHFLIADIPVNSGLAPDLWGTFIVGVREAGFAETLKLLMRAQSSAYHMTRSTKGLLVIPLAELNAMIRRLNLKAEVLSTRMSTNENRRHLLITF